MREVTSKSNVPNTAANRGQGKMRLVGVKRINAFSQLIELTIGGVGQCKTIKSIAFVDDCTF